MDPASFLGIVGSAVGIADIATKCVSKLRELQRRWKKADLKLNLLITQINTIRAALEQIARLVPPDTFGDSCDDQLMDNLKDVQACCVLVLGFIDSHVNMLERDEQDNLTTESKAKAVIHEGDINEWVTILEKQSNALNLLLTVISCQSQIQQKSLLEMKSSQKLFDAVRDDSASLLGLYSLDDDTGTMTTENTSKLSIVFDFDNELYNSKVYQQALRSNTKHAIRTTKELTTKDWLASPDNAWMFRSAMGFENANQKTELEEELFNATTLSKELINPFQPTQRSADTFGVPFKYRIIHGAGALAL